MEKRNHTLQLIGERSSVAKVFLQHRSNEGLWGVLASIGEYWSVEGSIGYTGGSIDMVQGTVLTIDTDYMGVLVSRGGYWNGTGGVLAIQWEYRGGIGMVRWYRGSIGQ